MEYGIKDFLQMLADDMNRFSGSKIPETDGNKLSDEAVKALADEFVNIIDNITGALSDGEYARSFSHKYHDLELCDMFEKDIHALANSDTPLSVSDVSKLMLMAGRDNSDFDINDYENWDDDMINKYAEHLKNYLYTYKDEAKNIDPEIDPNEEHVGPMAQDIEQVAPDCVKETPEGVKVVDGDRLALVNAGVIGDLSREVIELRSRLAALEAKV